MRKIGFGALGCALLCLIVTGGVSRRVAAQASPAIRLEPVVTGLSNPVYVTHSRDGSGRLFVVEQGGRIRVVENGRLLETPFLDIRSRLISGGERGLLGLAFHPNYPSNGRFFVNYTRTPDGATVIAEYRVSTSNRNLADPTERVLLTYAQPFANHNGGMIEFGPDNFLYIASGDGGSAGDPQNNSQNLENLLGKILRIDVDGALPYGIPPDNPFAGPVAGRDEIYAYGLRNPWRFSFDRRTGECYAGDVGQNRLEEVDVIVRGGNYGWRIMEGNLCFNPMNNCDRTGLVMPILVYGRSEGCSITGGYVYRGGAFQSLQGTYLYADYCQGTIWGFRDGLSTVLLASRQQISSFGEDESGEVYVVDISGTVSRIVPPITAPPRDDVPPVVRLLTPNGGERARAGTTLQIGWIATDNFGVTSQEIFLSTDGGATYPTRIATGLAGNVQSFNYAIPPSATRVKAARIRVIASDAAGNRAQASSAADFRIRKSQ